MGTEAKFTPGPWHGPHLSDDSCACNCTSIVDGGYAGGIASVHVHNGIDSISAGGNDAPPLEEAKANGRLIAAAPDLYEALTDARQWVEHNTAQVRGVSPAAAEPGEAMLRKIDAALSRARGGES